jgi:hypothetical protein
MKTRLRWSFVCFALVASIACAEGGAPSADGSSGDAPANPDAPTAALVPTREIVSGGARLAGGTLVMEAELGHAFGQGRMSGGSLRIEGATAVKR